VNRVCAQLGVEVPVICGAMYPCSNPELVAAVSEAGGLGVVQPISLTYVHGHDLREGLRAIRRLTAKPIGFNALVEQSSAMYLDRMRQWVDVAIEEGVRFFVTALGKPGWWSGSTRRAGSSTTTSPTGRSPSGRCRTAWTG
jgi:nitronate monooxygenase